MSILNCQSNQVNFELNPRVREDCTKYQIFIFLDSVRILEILKLREVDVLEILDSVKT